MYFRDLDTFSYHSGPFHEENWQVPLKAIGWLEHPHSFPTGALPDLVLGRLITLVDRVRQTFPGHLFRGTKTCSICKASGKKSPGPIWSQENLWVPGHGEVFLAPGGIVHYIQAHAYLPPQSFSEAVLACPDCDIPAYLEILRIANKGTVAPILPG